jgi:hypothetical protein
MVRGVSMLPEKWDSVFRKEARSKNKARVLERFEESRKHLGNPAVSAHRVCADRGRYVDVER